jgi:ABC-2 type transport system permease protein
MSVKQLLRDSLIVFERSFRLALRAPVIAFVFPLVIPLLIIVLVSEIYRDFARVPGFPVETYLAWITPGVLLMTAMIGAGYSVFGLVAEARNGYLDRLHVLPLRPAAILIGRMAFDVVRVAVAAVAVLGASVALGAPFVAGVSALPGLLLLVALWTLAYAGIHYAVGITTVSVEALSALVPLFMPVALVSSAFVPDILAPEWLEVAARVNPYAYVADGARLFVTEGFSWGPYLRATLVAGLTAIVTVGFASHRFVRLVSAD